MQVQLTLYTAGEIVADYIFDGTDSTQYSWFEKPRLTLTMKGPKLEQGTRMIFSAMNVWEGGDTFSWDDNLWPSLVLAMTATFKEWYCVVGIPVFGSASVEGKKTLAEAQSVFPKINSPVSVFYTLFLISFLRTWAWFICQKTRANQ